MRQTFFSAVLISFSLLFGVRSAHACPDVNGLVDLNCDGRVLIVCFGDSITAGVRDADKLGYPGRLRALLPNTQIINLGNPGERTANGKSRAARLFPVYAGADYFIVLEGVNDYFNDDRTAIGTRDNLQVMLRAARNTGGVALLGNLTDVRRDFQYGWVTAVNNRIGSMTNIDFFSLGKGIISSDLLHPNGPGYAQMALRAAEVLRITSNANRPVDSDGDGIYDFAEARFGTSSLIPDADGDGLLDGEEVFTYRSNPLALDSDGDGFSDVVEVREMGSDPADPRPSAPRLDSITVLKN